MVRITIVFFSLVDGRVWACVCACQTLLTDPIPDKHTLAKFCSLCETIMSEADTHTLLLLLEIWFNYVILIFGQMRSKRQCKSFKENEMKQKKTKKKEIN